MSDPQNPMLKLLLENERRLKQTQTKEMTPISTALLQPYTIGDLLYASSTSALAKLADVAVGRYLRSGGVGAAPLWSTLVLPNAAATGSLLHASATDTITALADVATGSVLRSGGVGVVPAYGKVDLTTDVTNYVEGTFTPTFQGSATAGTWTYTIQTGFYTRIGNRVFFSLSVQAATRPVAPTGTARITGLPLTSNATANSHSAIALDTLDALTLSGTIVQLTARVPPNVVYLELIESVGTAPSVGGGLAATGLGATAFVRASGHYQV